MLDWIERTVERLGYFGITLLMVAENVVPPIPSELIMPLAGWTAERGHLRFVGVVLAGTAGSVLGALIMYGVGRSIHEERLKGWVGRHGHWLLLTVEDVDRTIDGFRKHGPWIVLVGRLVPGIRSLVSIPAGLSRMSIGRFVGLSTVGTGLWAGALAWLGMLLGRHYGAVEDYVGPASAAILLGLVAAYVIRALRLKRLKRGRGG
jgi:membrane protein DedA with SNARE-associated domain